MSAWSKVEAFLSDFCDVLLRDQRRRLNGYLFGAGLLAGVLTLALSQFLSPTLGVTVLLSTLLLIAILSVLAPWWRARRLDTLAIAGLSEGFDPRLGSAPSGALDLALRRQGGEVLPDDLLEAHYEQTLQRLEGSSLKELAQKSKDLKKRRLYYFLYFCTGALLLATLVLSQGRRRLWALVQDPSEATFVDLPLARDIELIYDYPAYAKLPSLTRSGSDGSMSALSGSRVRYAALARHDLRRAEIHFTVLGAEQAEVYPLQIKNRRELSASIVIKESGHYVLQALTQDGDLLRERRSHPVDVLADAYPQVELNQPASDLELKDNESVNIEWRATDDFGLESAFLVIVQGASELTQRIPLQETIAKKSTGGQKLLALGEYLQESSEGLSFYIEVQDNDTVNGPKTERSVKRYVDVFSAKKHHEKLLLEQERLLGALVDYLGADLVAKAGTKAVQTHQDLIKTALELAQSIDVLAVSLASDVLAKAGVREAFRNVGLHLQSIALERRNALKALATLKGVHQDHIKTEEADVLYLDDLIATQKVDLWRQTAADLLDSKNKLAELLDEYRRTKDPNIKEEMLTQVQKLKEKMTELMQKMAKIKESLPGEYRNMEAAQQLELNEQMGELQEMLERGDVEGAAAELERLAAQLERMMDSMDSMEEEFTEQHYSEEQKAMEKLSQNLKALEQEQQALAERADAQLQKLRERNIKESGEDLDDVLQKARDAIAQAQQKLDRLAEFPRLYGAERDVEEVRGKLLDADSLLGQKDLAEARTILKSALMGERDMNRVLKMRSERYGQEVARSLRGAENIGRDAEDATQKAKDLLDKLFDNPAKSMTPREKQQLENMAEKQRQLQEQGAKLQQQMEALGKSMPILGEGAAGDMQQAKESMDGAQESMGAQKIEAGADASRRAADALGRLNQSLEQSQQQQGQGGKPGGGMPMPLGAKPRPGGQGQGSGRQSSPTKMEIPGTSAKDKSQAFREALMDASKGSSPEGYEDAVRQYYEDLVR